MRHGVLLSITSYGSSQYVKKYSVDKIEKDHGAKNCCQVTLLHESQASYFCML